MSGAIGYVDTVREDLLDAAWRSTMSEPNRPRRRRPSMRLVVVAATALSLVVAGVVGWQVLRTAPSVVRAGRASVRSIANEPRLRAPTNAVAPRPIAGDGSGNERSAFAAARPSAKTASSGAGSTVQSASADAALTQTGSIRPTGEFAKVIKTGRVSIVVGHDTFGQRFTAVGDIADRLGGYVSSSSTSDRSGYATMRIPANHFQDALRSLRGLGRTDSETIQGKDVTAQYVDLSSRIRIARARRRVLFGLMRQAVSIDQTIRVQNALDDVQLRIEELQGELDVLNSRVDEATIRVSMREQGVKVGPQSTVQNPSIPGALDRAIAGFFSVVAAVIVGLGWVIPTLAVLLALWFLAVRVRRRFA